ncbi:MAG: hexosaminidase, partial [Planctomycetota bacterium]
TGAWLQFPSGIKAGTAGLSKALVRAIRACPILRGPDEARTAKALVVELRPELTLCGSQRTEGYRLEIRESGVRLSGTDEAGIFYGLQSLAALAGRLENGVIELPEISIEDWPDFSHRAISLDVSRDKVPLMQTLFELVDYMASWKLNQLQLYMEHVFAYEGHEEVWGEASAFTPPEIRTLDRYCRERFIELVPNQNSLAHFHRWLKLDRYRPLSEVPEGIIHPFCPDPEPFSLCPTDPRSLELIEELYDQLLPNFSSKLVHVGLDEPMDLGWGRSKSECDQLGKPRVFLNYLKAVQLLAHKHGREMQFWAEWILSYPEHVAELPDDVIAMAWGYEADHPFEAELKLLASAVSRYYVCPGTSSWNSIAGRTSNAFGNLKRAGCAGFAEGAEGYMITDWGDNGHWQPLSVSYAGFILGASVAWNSANTPTSDELATHLDRTIFKDRAGRLGRIALDLGDAHLAAEVDSVNGSVPFFLIHFAEEPLPHERLPGLTKAGIEACLLAIDAATDSLAAVDCPRSLERDEFMWSANLMRLGCKLGLARLSTSTGRLEDIVVEERNELSRALDKLCAVHRELWVQRNRLGGLKDSVGRLERLSRLLRA